MTSTFVLSFLFLGVASNVPIAMAQSPGTFTGTGNMTTQRSGHTATLLTTGNVLIAGGSAILQEWPVWSTAEMYDPSTGTFTATGSMASRRAGHTATLLPNGRVLIAGGFSTVSDGAFGGFSRSAELYDPSTRTFSATGDMTAARLYHAATLLNNGKVLITGGGINQPLASAELYDPSTGSFTATVPMTVARGSHKATLLSNGKVLIDGGHGGDDYDIRPSAEIYDPGSGTFSLSGRTSYPGTFPTTASLLTNGTVLVTEQYSCDPSELAEVYDPSTEAFSPTGNMIAPRLGSNATPLPDGRVLIAGMSYHGGFDDLGKTELYDTAAGTFSPTDRMSLGRQGHTSTLLPDGTVLIAGGGTCCSYSLDTALIYHPAVLVRSPVLFSVAGGAQGAILHSGTGQVVSAGNPAVAGEALEIYLTGLTDGSVIPPQVAIGGRMAEVLFFGKAPGFANLNQVNVRVPGGVTPGSAVGVRLTYLSRPSNEVTLGVR